MLNCLATLLGRADAPLPPEATRAAHLALRFGAWMDTLPVIRLRATSVVDRLMQCLRAPAAGRMPSVLAATQAAAYLRNEGVQVASWEEAIPGQADLRPRGDEPSDCLRGWQRTAAHSCDERALEMQLSALTPASRALLLSQAGPHSARALTVPPTSEDVSIPRPTFGSSSSVAFASPCRLARVPAPAEAHSMSTATIVLLVPRLASSPPEPFRSSGPSRGSAKKPEPALVVTLLWRP